MFNITVCLDSFTQVSVIHWFLGCEHLDYTIDVGEYLFYSQCI